MIIDDNSSDSGSGISRSWTYEERALAFGMSTDEYEELLAGKRPLSVRNVVSVFERLTGQEEGS